MTNKLSRTLLSRDQIAALDWKWWTFWDQDPTIHSAFKVGYLQLWLPFVQSVLDSNKQNNSGFATSWRKLSTALHRNEKQVARDKKTAIPGTLLRFNYAFALGVSAEAFPPSHVELLQRATMNFLRRPHSNEAAKLAAQRTERRPSASVGADEALCYAAYVLSNAKLHKEDLYFDGVAKALEKIKERSTFANRDDVVERISKSATQVGYLLTTEYLWLEEYFKAPRRRKEENNE